MIEEIEGQRVASAGVYIAAGVVLLLLTALTIGLAFVPLGVWQTPVALGIAAVKALLIVLFFMHLRDSVPLLRLVVLMGLLWLSILIGLTMDDYLTRTWFGVPGH